MRIGKIIIKIAFLLSLVTVPAAVFAQGSSINTFSPYSFYGIGDISRQGTTAMHGMGGVGLGSRSRLAINYLNPASYTSIGRRTVLFDVGLESQNYYLSSAQSKSSYNTFNLRNIALQLPLAEKVGFAFSVSPYSSVGYRISGVDENSDILEGIGNVRYQYSGAGGVNQFKAGVGWAPLTWLSIGAEAVYYQGNITRNFKQTITPVTGSGYYLGISSDNQEHVNRILANFGLQATLFSQATSIAQNKRTLTLGATYNMGGKLNSRISEVIMHGPYFTSMGYDPVVNKSYKSDFRMPDIFGVGLFYNSPKLSAGVDYYYSGWGVNGDVSDNISYRNTNSVAAGLQFIPKPGDIRRVMNNWSYRIGARYNEYYMVVNGQKIDETAITLGLGIPLGMRGVNNINLGIELGTRGQTSHGLVKENYFKISVGISLFGDDYWFMKQKYD